MVEKMDQKTAVVKVGKKADEKVDVRAASMVLKMDA